MNMYRVSYGLNLFVRTLVRRLPSKHRLFDEEKNRACKFEQNTPDVYINTTLGNTTSRQHGYDESHAPSTFGSLLAPAL